MLESYLIVKYIYALYMHKGKFLKQMIWTQTIPNLHS